MLEWIPDLVRVLINCANSVGDHSTEQHLREMAQACRDVATKVQGLQDQNIVPAQKALADSQWKGPARANFDVWWKSYINPPENTQNISDAEVIKRCNEAAKALDTIAEAAGQTKHAFNKLIASVIFWIAAGAVLSALLTWAGMAAAWAFRIRVLAAAGQLTSRYAWLQRMLASVLRLLKPLTLYSGKNAIGARSLFLRGLEANRKIGWWSFGGNVGATVLANGVFQVGTAVVNGVQGKPVHWSDPTAMSLSQIGDLIIIGRFGGLTGPASQTAALTRLAANNSRLLNLGFGAAAGVAPLVAIDTIFDPKPWWDSGNPLNSKLVRWGMSAGVASTFNAWVGSKFPGPGGMKETAVRNSEAWGLVDRKLLTESNIRTPDGRPALTKWAASDRTPFDQELVSVRTERIPADINGRPIPLDSNGAPVTTPAFHYKVLTEVGAPGAPHAPLTDTHRLLTGSTVDPSVPYESLAINKSHNLLLPFRPAALSRFTTVRFTSPADPFASPIYYPKDSTTPPPWFTQRMEAGKTIFTPLTALPIKATTFNNIPGTMAQSSLLSYEPSIGLAGMRAFASTGPQPHMEQNHWDVPTQAGAPVPVHPDPPSVPQPPPPPPPPPMMGGQSITVSAWGHGDYDSLWKIAAEVYGDPRLWTTIYDANRQVIGDNPNAIRDGTVLKIPEIPKPTSKTSH